MSPAGEHAGLPRSTVMVAAVAILFAGLMTFFILKWAGARTATQDAKAQMADLQPKAQELTTNLAAVQGQLDKLKGQTNVLTRGKFKVCNRSHDAIVVVYLAATYLDEQGNFQTFNSSEYGKDLWRLEAGQIQELNYLRGDWDGSVTYYAAEIHAGNNDYLYAGAWPLDEDFCILWSGA